MHDADRIVRDLAACEPPFDYDEGDPGREYQCTLCEVGIATYDEDPKLHKPSCPWRRAKELNP